MTIPDGDDPKGNAEEPKGDEPTPTLAETARASVAEKDEVDEPKGDATSTGEGEPEPTGLSDEEVEKLANDPKVRAAILGGDGDLQEFIDKQLRDVLAEENETRAQRQEVERKTATWQEALKKAEEDEDFTEVGRLAYESVKSAQAEAQLRSRVEPAAAGRTVEQLNAVIEAEYADEIDKLTDEDYDGLQRANFETDQVWLGAVVHRLNEVRHGAVKTAAQQEAEEASKVATRTETGQKARADAVAALPGGTATETHTEDSIGSLMRKGMEGAFDYEE